MITTFADLTTMRVGGPIRQHHVATTVAEAVEVVRDADSRRDPLLVIGGGSNLVVGDVGWDGTVLQMAQAEFDIDGDRVRAGAGVEWEPLVERVVAEGLAGIEALSGIPGSVGGTPVQNVGAYGALTSDVLESVSVLDRTTGEIERWGSERCGFGRHRTSVFKRSDRWVVLEVTYRLRRAGQSGPIEFDGLVKELGVEKGGTASLADVRAAVLTLRRNRKMVLDAGDHDTWSVGSFFLNPVLAEVPDRVPAECPRWPDATGIKLPAAWLIEQSGFSRGYGLDWGNGTVALSSRHTLAITNRGGATTADVMKFAAHLRDGVAARFGVTLSPECDLVNCAF
ncbi:UDP-N-acetylmuramate dehydrogenase [Virgisporangium ochraceum]|uniref:UDP-N-acetylenolpyruvoylglucosamine reductase n=1 Tax=Virgisporangium ochraceum TaxID=65505 RepID=A0A8J4A1V5_9ACTN|nr:UDP-N-acetylmuramate dehydrogenase [Virgisporangium ochraceum]GIJ71765.1 UDP-N-acetylenolpyruvoylglucosamine reductase [Virgisporangium ochraceum]